MTSSRLASPHPAGSPLPVDTSDVPDYTAFTDLHGTVHMVFGGGNGMGRQSSHALSQHGATVVCIDYEADRAERVAGEVTGMAIQADARVPEDVQRCVDETLERYGRIDGVVDIVGMARWAKLVETSDDDWDWTLDMNVRHAFLLLRHIAPAMGASGGGSFTFLSSIDGVVSAPNHVPYGVAKAGLLSLVRTACVELGSIGVRVNAICPGPTITPRVMELTGGIMPRNRAEGGMFDIPLGEANRMSDITAAILFFSSPLSRMVSGQALSVDGGGTQLVYDLARVPGA